MIRRLLILNGLAIFGVILFHSSGWGFVAMYSWAHRYLPVISPNYDQVGSLSYYAFRVIEQLVVVSIPAFLFVSGFFIAFATGRSHTTVRWTIIGARIKNLLIPYLFWSLVILIMAYFLEGKKTSALGYVKLLLIGGASPAYYYVILLGQFYLISPFLVPLAKTRWVLLLVVAALFQLIVQTLQYPIILDFEAPAAVQPVVDIVPKWFFLTRIFWFTSGIIAGFHLKDLKKWISQLKWILLTITVVSFVLGVFEWEMYIEWSGHKGMTHRETLIDTLYSASFLLTFLAFNKFSIPFSKQIGELGAKSFGIYLVHVPVVEYVARTIYHFAPRVLASQIIFQLIIIVSGLGIPLLLMAGVKRSPGHRFYQYMFG